MTPPLAALLHPPKLPYDYFKQMFAQACSIANSVVCSGLQHSHSWQCCLLRSTAQLTLLFA